MSGESTPGGPGDLPAYAERVLATAELIPPGRVMTYGDVAEWLGESGPRQVGRVMALYGGAVPWWRVVRADGVLLPGHETRALAHYRAEGTPLRQSGGSGRPPRIDLAAARWDGGSTPAGESGAAPRGPERGRGSDTADGAANGAGAETHIGQHPSSGP
ncbi:MGMT family protein [Streptomyces sp. F63]|nr:MGMT family protein [Streptomyces sp. F63]